MENISADVIDLLQYLLPGFLAAWVFYGFTSHPKPSQFERVVQALIFTLFARAGVFCIEVCYGLLPSRLSLPNWSANHVMLGSIFCAIAIGLAFAYCSNFDKFHGLVRKCGITRETAYPSEWFGVFAKTVTYVVLHLKDERRIYGWPIEWPSEPQTGHFSLEQVSWLTADGEIPIEGVESVLIRAEDVRWVEFMNKSWEKSNGQEITEPSAATN